PTAVAAGCASRVGRHLADLLPTRLPRHLSRGAALGGPGHRLGGWPPPLVAAGRRSVRGRRGRGRLPGLGATPARAASPGRRHARHRPVRGRAAARGGGAHPPRPAAGGGAGRAAALQRAARPHSRPARPRRALQREEERSERLLLNVLPAPIAARLKQHEDVIADGFPEVTVLFADLVDFTRRSQRSRPQQVVQFLDELFSAFDQLTRRHGLEKIKTIGDAYMVAGGLPDPWPDHPQAVADLALAMREEVAGRTD